MKDRNNRYKFEVVETPPDSLPRTGAVFSRCDVAGGLRVGFFSEGTVLVNAGRYYMVIGDALMCVVPNGNEWKQAGNFMRALVDKNERPKLEVMA